jgi:hypothetical protein
VKPVAAPVSGWVVVGVEVVGVVVVGVVVVGVVGGGSSANAAGTAKAAASTMSERARRFMIR